ncbi:Cytidylate kinase [Desulfovibrionales bacterium]
MSSLVTKCTALYKDLKEIITLDGPAGVGKTTLARQVAEALDMVYLDTGAMFRALAWVLGESCLSLDQTGLTEQLAALHFTLTGTGQASTLFLNGQPLNSNIRTETIALLASRYAQLPAVRDFLRIAQRDISVGTPLTAEGRDMGTVVFPNARWKFLLDAVPKERAHRRWHQLIDLGQPADLTELSKQIYQRDYLDRTRTMSPLIPAEDAVIIDTTNLTVEDVLKRILRVVRQ